ncbi:MAG TPA: ATP-binding protein [Spirochaetota bacterium]|nr:ATP-binding protein [Spirochaetota bacterium]HPV41108.1 ATP-binding protein [Spirochaetota bacterium]
MNIAIASGKGGTGKTTIAMTLAHCYAGNGADVALLDCDVEEPNVNLFLKAGIDTTKTATVLIPRVDETRCNGCGECERICAFSAIVLVKGKPLLFADMCHSCGGCYHVCAPGAISEVEKPIGTVEYGSRDGIAYAGGKLNIGEAMSPPLIRKVKESLPEKGLRILDSPPGTSCPAVEAMRDADFVVLVTEPTPFGLNDLILAVGAVRALGIPFGVIVNRSGMGDGRVDDYCKTEGIEVLSRIPHIRKVAEDYSRGDCASYLMANHADDFKLIIDHIAQRAKPCIPVP